MTKTHFDEGNYEKLLQVLGRANVNRSRLEKLARSIREARSGKEAVLKALFPDKGPEEAAVDFRQFKSRVNRKAREYGIPLVITEREGRVLLLHPKEASTWARDEAAVEAGSRSAAQLEGEPTPIQALASKGDRPLVQIFISYAQRDRKQVMRLLDELWPRLQIKLESAMQKGEPEEYSGAELSLFKAEISEGEQGILVDFWRDQEKLPPGEDVKKEIEDAIDRSVVGLFMVSPHALTSRFIRTVELPRLLEGNKLIPVGLTKIDFGDLKPLGLDGKQVFLMATDEGGKFFTQLRHRRGDFAGELAARLVRRIETYLFDGPIEQASKELLPVKGLETAVANAQQEKLKQESFSAADLISPNARVGVLDAAAMESQREPNSREGLDALKELKAWARGEYSEPLAVVLGEYGMGKTTLTRWLTLELLKEREENRPDLPLPIYFDLRNLSTEVREKPKLEAILQELIENWWKSGGARDRVTPQQVIELVRSRRAFAIFDGLDEVLVYLDPAGGERFVRELWSIAYSEGEVVGRAIMTSRSHYFRTVQDAVNYFKGQGREGIQSNDYFSLLLLPFTEEQIFNYFKQSFGSEEQARKAMELVRSVHNLGELAQRPFLLSLIREHLEALERLKAAGRQVSAAEFYRLVVDAWIRRDNPKHQIRPQHKLLFMEHLAAELWRSKERSWHVDRLEDWFVQFLEENPRLRAHYPERTTELLERLKEDLRTATFLVHDGSDNFRFAHTSLQEFFLASYLLHATESEAYDRWNMPTPSPETFDFLAQLWRDHSERERLFKNARAMGREKRPRANENLVRFLLFARERYPEFQGFSFARFDLSEVSLKGLELGNPDLEGQKVNWAGARFEGAVLREARFTNANLDGASFSGADLTRAEFWRARAVRTNFEGANLAGAFFRECDLRDARYQRARFRRTKWVRSRLEGAAGLPEGAPEGFFARNEGASLETRPEEPAEVLPPGVMGGINAITLLPDGDLALGGIEGLQILDPKTGETLSDIKTPGSVFALAPLPDGHLTLGGTNGLQILDLETGEVFLDVKTPGWVYALSLLPDGRLILSGARWLHILDPETGETIAEVETPISVYAIAPIPEDRLAVGSRGGLWIFNTKTGKRSLVFVLAASGEYLSINGFRIMAASPRAWRWAFVRGRDPVTGKFEVYPYEAVGELPPPKTAAV